MIGFRQLVQFSTCLSKVQFNFYRTTMTSLLVPPPSVRGQNKVDYEAFKVTLENIPCVLLPTKTVNMYRRKLQDYFLKFPNFKPVQASETETGKSIIYLDPRKVKEMSDEIKENVVGDQKYEEREIKLSYENWTCEEILRAILPEVIEVPMSYSRIGHIIHLNLRNKQLPYKDIIGQVFLEKTPNIKTVVNKLDTIDNTYRNFAMEIIAGEHDTIVSVKETNCTYQFDFAKVYWNPRLSTEHAALVSFLKKDDVLYDVFAGVGPFSLPAARKGVRVLANDLNPESYKWLIKNVEINKVKKLLTAYNKDGRDFLRNDVKQDILSRREKSAPGSEHVSMNLPALAVKFLDVFPNWLNPEEVDKVCTNPPTIHVYCFVKAGKNEDLLVLTKQLVEEKLGAAVASMKIHHVRNVAPFKEMMRASFPLTREIILKSEGEPARKRTRLTHDPHFSGPHDGQEQEQEQGQERV